MESIQFLNLEHVFLFIYTFFQNLDPVAILNAIIRAIVWLRPVALVICLFFIGVFIYSKIQMSKLEKIQDESVFGAKKPSLKPDEAPAAPVNEKWLRVASHMNSPNPNDWRMAIFEADILLGEALEKAGFGGDSIGDKLKAVDPTNMLTLDMAWEAHRVRNALAHEGSSFQLNEREARRVIDLYERSLRELKYL